MALEELRKNIEHEAKASASKLEGESDSESEAIIKKAHEEAIATRKKAKEEVMSEVERRRKEALTAIEMEANAILSAAKEDRIDLEMKRFAGIVRKKLNSRQQEIIKSALKRFSDVVPAEEAVAKVSKKNAAILKSYKAKIEYANVDGVILSSLDKRVTADASIDGLMQSNSDAIRRSLSKGMFG